MTDNGPCNCEQALELIKQKDAYLYRLANVGHKLKQLCSCDGETFYVCPTCVIEREIQATRQVYGE